MSGGSVGTEAGVRAARARALAVLRMRGRALGAALLPAAAAVILLAGKGTGHLVGPGWDAARWIVSGVAVVVLLATAAIALLVARARPALSPTVPIPESAAPDLYRLVRDLADRLDVPAPSAIALTPDCDSWLEDRTHRAHGTPQPPRRDEVADPRGPGRTAAAPVLVIGSPFLWWMRVGELRAVLAPVVAGTGPSAHPDIAAARRFVRGLDAAVAVAAGRSPRLLFAGAGYVVRLLLRGCRVHAAEMERGVAAAAAERAQAVDYGLRIVAQEQVGLAYAGWDRLLTRVALPAWRMGRWPSRLDAGVVAALTELSRRDRLAEGFASRLGERPACDLLEEPGTIDEATSLLAARLFHGGPAEPGPDWSPVTWQDYPDEVVDRKWRTDAARLHRTLDALGVRRTPGTNSDAHAPTLARVLEHLTEGESGAGREYGVPGTDPGYDADERNAGAGVDAGEQAAGAGADAEGAGERGAGAGRDAEVSWAAGERNAGARDADAGRGAGGRDDEDRVTDGRNAGAGLDAEAGQGTGAGRGVGEHDAGAGASRGASERNAGAGHDARARDAGAGPGAGELRVGAATGSGERGAGSRPGTEPDAGARPADGEPRVAAEPDAAEPDAAAPDADPGQSPRTAPDQDDPSTPDLYTDDDLRYLDDADLYPEDPPALSPRTSALAARLSAELARDEAAAPRPAPGATPGPDTALWDDAALPLFPLQPPRTERELLADHVTAMVCCAAMDTAGAAPGLDWLDGPVLLIAGERAPDLTPRVLSLVEDGDPDPLRVWLVELGIRPEKPLRLV